jgi:hypothetical protein
MVNVKLLKYHILGQEARNLLETSEDMCNDCEQQQQQILLCLNFAQQKCGKLDLTIV